MTSGRGGSIMPTRPRKVSPCSRVSGEISSGISASSLQPIASTRSAPALMASLTPAGVFQVAGYAAGGHDVERALDDGDEPAVHAVNRGHQLAVGVEGDFAQAGILAVQLVLGHAVFVAASTMAVSVGSPMCFSSAPWNTTEPSQQRRAVHEQPPDFLGVLRADGLGAPALVQIRLHQRHAVLRERARFVRADHGSAAPAFPRPAGGG